jgi:hypothetical protein
MSKNNSLFAVAALFALLGIANINADAFDVLRPDDEREEPNGDQRSVGLGFVEVETKGGQKRTEFKPLESMFGGNRSSREERRSNRYYDQE